MLQASKQGLGSKVSIPQSPSLGSLHFDNLQEQAVQKVGDTWVASGVLPPGSAGNTPELESAPRLASQHTGRPSPVHSPAPIALNPQLTGPATAAALEDMAAAADDSDVPPPPPPKPRPRSTLIEERMRAFGTPQRLPVPQEIHTEPIKQTAPLRLRKATPPQGRESEATLRTQETAATLDSPRTAGRRPRPRVPTFSSAAPTGEATASSSSSTPLREASLRIFNNAEDKDTPSRRSAKMEDRIRAWQPRPEDTPPPPSRAGSGRSQRSQATGLSFDPSDLNPSRSASQIRPRTEPKLDLAGVDAKLAPAGLFARGANERPEGVGGPRSPMRKDMPWGEQARLEKAAVKAVEPEDAYKSEVELAEPETLAAQLHAPSVPEPMEAARAATTTPQPRDLPQSPKATPGRLNARMLAAAAVFEPSIVDRVGSAGRPQSRATDISSPLAQNTASLRKSPSLKAPVARATTSIAQLEQMMSAKSDVSDSKVETPSKPATRGTPATMEKETPKEKAVVTPSAPKSVTSGVSGTSVRERIEALSRAQDAPTHTPKIQQPLASSVASPRAIPSTVTPMSPQHTARSSKAPLSPQHTARSFKSTPMSPQHTARSVKAPLSPQHTARSAKTTPLSPQHTAQSSKVSTTLRGNTAPLTLRRTRPASEAVPTSSTAPLSPPQRRTLFVANPSPDSPEPQSRETLSDVAERTAKTPEPVAAEFESAATPKSSFRLVDSAVGTRGLAPSTVTASRGLSTVDSRAAREVPSTDDPTLDRHLTTTSRVDDSTADDAGSAVTATTKYTTERDTIDGVLADYDGTRPSTAQSAAAESRDLTAMATGSGTDATALPANGTAAHGSLSQQLDDVQFGVNALAASVGTMSALVHSREERDAELDLPERLDALNDGLVGIHSAVATLPPDLTARLTALGTDLRGIQMVLYESSAQIAALAAKEGAEDEEKGKDKELPPPPAEAGEPALPEINAKLDALAVLIQEVLARQDAAAAAAAKTAAAAGAGAAVGAVAAKEAEADKVAPTVPADKDAAKEAPKEAADAPAAAAPAPAADPATAAQIAEIQAAVAKLGEERALQTQQTADIAKCKLRQPRMLGGGAWTNGRPVGPERVAGEVRHQFGLGTRRHEHAPRRDPQGRRRRGGADGRDGRPAREARRGGGKRGAGGAGGRAGGAARCARRADGRGKGARDASVGW